MEEFVRVRRKFVKLVVLALITGTGMGALAITAVTPTWFVIFAILCALNIGNAMKSLGYIKQLDLAMKELNDRGG